MNGPLLTEKQPRLGRKTSFDINRIYDADRVVHDWYRFVLSYPPHLVRDYVDRFGISQQHTVLDPFCGMGTTLVECQKLGIKSVGVEAHPMTSFASKVKTDWTPDPKGLEAHASLITSRMSRMMMGNSKWQQMYRISPELRGLLLKDSISPLPEAKSLLLLDLIRGCADKKYLKHELLAFAKMLVARASNLRFGPEVGLGVIKQDAPVVESWLEEVQRMAHDLDHLSSLKYHAAQVFQGDSRSLQGVLSPRSIDAVITSPPYPNEKDYTRTTRLESVVLGFIKDKAALQSLKRTLICSNTRNVYRGDDDDEWVSKHSEIRKIAEAIECRRIALGKTSGFERLYARVAKLYFGGITRHLSTLRPFLRSGARLAYVVGDQASYLRVMIKTGRLLAEIAESLGYRVESIDLFRTRFATATGEQLREEVVVLRWDS